MSDDRPSAKLCILFLTYNRMQYADQCLRAVIKNVRWDGDLHIHIADDGSPADYRDALHKIAGGYSKVCSAGVSNSERRGYGANYNLSTQHIHDWSDYVLVVEDDWRLDRSLDCTKLVLGFGDGRIGCIRLGYLGSTQRLSAELIRVGGRAYWLLDPDSPEPHVWAGHPRLETVAWQREQGCWPEGLDPNMTEFVAARWFRRGVAWPTWLDVDGDTYFTHIGTERAR